jgi:hypothetical protein
MSKKIETAQKNLDFSIADAIAKCEGLQRCLVEIVTRASVLRGVTPQSGGGGVPEGEE